MKKPRDEVLHGPGDLEDKLDRALAEGDAEDKRAKLSKFDERVLAAVAGGRGSAVLICEKLYQNHNDLHSSLRKRNMLRVDAALQRLRKAGRVTYSRADGWKAVTP